MLSRPKRDTGEIIGEVQKGEYHERERESQTGSDDLG